MMIESSSLMDRQFHPECPWPDMLLQDKSKVLYGQWWRFYTTTLLHANLLHLLVRLCLPSCACAAAKMECVRD